MSSEVKLGEKDCFTFNMQVLNVTGSGDWRSKTKSPLCSVSMPRLLQIFYGKFS